MKSGQQIESADGADSGSSLATRFLSGLDNLGLKVESEKGQVEMLVIEHLEKPPEN